MFKLSRIVALTAFILIFGCDRNQTDEQRILEAIDTTSVHLLLGTKILVVNPNNDPDIDQLKTDIEMLLVTEVDNKPPSLSVAETIKLAKIAYKMKAYGEDELALGRESNLNFIQDFVDDHDTINKLNSQQDHALFLILLNLTKLNPATPVPITKEQMLYEAWMAGEVEFENKTINAMLRAAQVSAYASNEFCDFASLQAQWFKNNELKETDVKPIIAQLTIFSTALARATAHAPEAAAGIFAVIMAPQIIEILPNSLRLLAHVNTAKCYENKGKKLAAYQQKIYAIDTLEDLGAPKAELALYRASLAYKTNDLDGAANYLREAAKNPIFDERTRDDMSKLADNIHSPNEGLINQYLNKFDITLALLNIVNERLSDEGAYNALTNSKSYQKIRLVFDELTSTPLGNDDGSSIIDKGKGLFSK